MDRRRNIEVKARVASLGVARQMAREIPADFRGTLHQIDTYFSCSQGRLKLREIKGQGAELIWYSRSDEGKPRASHYMICEIEHPSVLSVLLDSALSTIGRVEKKRDLFLWKNVRIHLDDVSGLGTFLEFEAVMPNDSDDAEGHALVQTLLEKFRISASDVLKRSYIDMS